MSNRRFVVVGEGRWAAHLGGDGVGAIVSVRGVDELASVEPGDVLVEVGGPARFDQMAMLRSLSAAAPDDTIIISTSPMLGLAEMSESITNPARLVRVVPARPENARLAEIVMNDHTDVEALSVANELCFLRGWRVFPQRDAGPTALTRIFAKLAIECWRLAVDSGNPAAIDRLANLEGLRQGPLRTLDALGLVECATLTGRLDQVGDVDEIYKNGQSDQLSTRFRANCVTHPIAVDASSGYFISTIIRSLEAVWADGLFDDRRLLRRLVILGLGLHRRTVTPWYGSSVNPEPGTVARCSSE